MEYGSQDGMDASLLLPDTMAAELIVVGEIEEHLHHSQEGLHHWGPG